MSVIEFARQRMEEESREPDGGDCRYWRGGPGGGPHIQGGPTWMEP